ncbi:KR domain-containing protein [Sarocladium implicatum]|nr:KR domain-containing protein [Sarocladium implicatum]
MASGGTERPAVAITGLSCRFPGDGVGPSNFWDSICDGKSAWSEIPRDRFNAEAFWSGDNKKRHGSITKSGHFLKDDVSQFDANFFSISRAEANAMDPQHRLMLEVTYEALESAGYPVESLAGTRTGVFMGHFTGDYKELVLRDADAMPPYSTTGLNKTSLANRISWTFDLRGPSFSLDTACSSSLVAFHIACQSLRTGESDMAIVGGSNLLLNPEMFIAFSGQGFLSADGKCKSFDASGDGYGRGEGIAVVILKRADDAISAQDPLRSIIRGTGSNQDGHTKSLTLPRAEAQQALIEEVYGHAGLDFSQTGYVEAHGTGTQAGDKEETLALSRTISQGRSRENELIVGSVKANIGHLEAASGLAGVIKSTLALENGRIPPQISFKNPNPSIKFDEWHLKIPTALTPWPAEGVRRVSINSFGYGGSNAHAILDDAYHYLHDRGLQGQHYTKHTGSEDAAASDVEDDSQMDSPRIFMLSAQDRNGLTRAKKSLSDWLRKRAETVEDEVEEYKLLGDLAHTLNSRRSKLQWKTFAVGSSIEELTESLSGSALEAMSSTVPRLAFVFTGQGAQWATMGMKLMAFPEFRSSIEAADRFLKKELGCRWSIQIELARGKATTKLGLALYSQTLCTILQVALLDLLKSWGIVPEAVVGHSSGEIAAAYCAGFLSQQDAWKIAYSRGVAASKMKEQAFDLDGAMMAVGASPERCADFIRETCPDAVDIACVNSPSSVTLSGDATAIDALQKTLKAADIFCRKLLVDTAYHSKHMKIVAEGYRESLSGITPLSGKGSGCRMHSSVTKSQVQASQLGPDYWVQNLVSPVQFAAAVEDLTRSSDETGSIDVFVEVGPHNALQGPVTQTLQSLGPHAPQYLSTLVRNKDQVETVLGLVGSLVVHGLPVDLGCVNHTDAASSKTLIDLPSYAWNHGQQYWAESRLTRAFKQRESQATSLLGAPVPSTVDKEHTWRGFLRPSEEPWVADHRIQGSVLYPGAGFLVMAIEAALQIADRSRKITDVLLQEVEFLSAMLVAQDRELEHIVTLRPFRSSTSKGEAQWMEFVICSSPDSKSLVRNCHGQVRMVYENVDGTSIRPKSDAQSQYQEATASCHSNQDAGDFYQGLDQLGLTYGPAFARVANLSAGNGRSCSTLIIPDVGLESNTRPHIIHPTTLDASFHLAFAAANSREGDELTTAMVPRYLGEMRLSMDIPYAADTSLTAFSSVSISLSQKELTAGITIMNSPEAETSSLEISGLKCVEIAQGAGSQDSATLERKLCSKLIWKPAADLLNAEEMQTIITDNGRSSTGIEFEQLKEYIELLHHTNPNIRVVEVTEGSSSLAAQLKLSSDTTRTLNYTILCADDVSKDQFDNSETLPKWLKVETLASIQKSIEEDGNTANADLVLCRSSAAGVARTVQTARTLAKEGGNICLVQVDSEIAEAKAVLKAKDLTFLYDFSATGSHNSVVAVALKETQSVNGVNGHHKDKQVALVVSSQMSADEESLSSKLESLFSEADVKVTKHAWGVDDILSLQGKDCISLLEIQSSLLEALQEPDFARLQKLILESKSLLWLDALDDARSGLFNGMARVLRNEVPGLHLRTLHIPSSSMPNIEKVSSLTVRLWESGTIDNEFRLENDVICVSRIVEDAELNDSFGDSGDSETSKIDNIPLSEVSEQLQLSIQRKGQPHFSPTGAQLQVGEDEIEVEVKAVTFSASNTTANAPTDLDNPPLCIAAGLVRSAGPNVQYREGDAVVIYTKGSSKTVERCKATLCAPMPQGFTFEEGSRSHGAYAAAWYGLVRIARVQKGQSVLIHDDEIGTGQAAAEIAKHYGLEVYVVTESARDESLSGRYDLPDDHIFTEADPALHTKIKQVTGQGVDIVFRSSGGGSHLQSLLAPLGTIIEASMHESVSSGQRNLPQDATFSSFSLSGIANQSPIRMGEIIRGVSQLQESSTFRPVTSSQVFSASEVQDAVEHVQKGAIATLSFKPDDTLPVKRARPSMRALDSSSTYVLVGGLGGLGRSLALMLAENGAKKLCFLSRSGASSQSAKTLIQDLEGLGLQAECYKCDVSDPTALQSSLDKCTEDLGPVRGVIQCAMVLRDTLFSNMSYEDWTQSTLPKVQGTQNLHNALPEVDFFITLSSFAATFGNRGQSNYAAGCAYQDALALQRRAEGKAAVSLDVGLMRDVGVLAETGMTENLKDWVEPYGVRETELLDLVKLAIGGRLPAQVLTGLATGGSALVAGIPTPFYLSDAKFSIMAKTDMEEASRIAGVDGGDAGNQQQDSVRSLVSNAKDTREAAEHVAAALVKRVAKLLELAEHDVDTSRALHSYGLDSLAAIEVVDWALKEISARINVFDVMAAEPITATAMKIAKASTLVEQGKE